MMTIKLMHRGLRILLHAIAEQETCNCFSKHDRAAGRILTVDLLNEQQEDRLQIQFVQRGFLR
ncbi:hypothetical protein PsorP6_004895 [Peronosclerospora sorghi]|uniref:Uncharacterized protein n=1 Tax=Peronosclerospora sorghi TaxID=230839 RepID=A0ACC0W524_9STRA|nr:hypothetical protein PsorP6_004895 [Peronosclerospora sorghi]